MRTAVALFLVSVGLRPQLVGVGPLLPEIQADLAIGHAVAGLLGTIPVLCMGVFALAGPWFGRMLGAERAIAAGVAATFAFGLLRAAAPEATSVLLLTLGVGVGIAVVGPLMPAFVGDRSPGRAPLLTGVYAGGIVVGSTLAAALAIPLAGPTLDWRLSLAAFALAAGGALVAWLVLEPRSRTRAVAPTLGPPPRLPWTSRRAWALAALFGAQSALYYAAGSWLPSIYVERGWSEVDAGFLLALLNGIGLLATFGAPLLAERWGSRREHLFLSAVAALIGLVGIAAGPDLAVVSVAILGIGLGAVFPFVLTLPVDFGTRPGDVGGLAAIMLFGGYVLSSVAPSLLGLIRQTTGSFDSSVWLLVAAAVALVAACWLLVPAGIARRGRPDETYSPL
jgi:CP family cyanate transporter-like MFS transporter